MFAFLYHPEINPTILPIYGPLAIRWYSLMYIVGFALVYFIIWMRINKKQILLTADELSDVAFSLFLGLLIGARAGFILFYDFSSYLAHPLNMIKVWEGGMSFHGGCIGMVAALIIYAVIKKKNVWDLGDIFAAPVPIALACGRWGNFVNGELWGRPTSAPWGMIFPTVPETRQFSPDLPWVQKMIQDIGLSVLPGTKLVNLPRHPSQLYELILEGLVLFSIMMILAFKKKKPSRGVLFSLFFMGYGLARIFVEFFREPDSQLGYLYGGWFTMGMTLSLPMVLLGLGGLIYFSIKGERNELWA